MGTNSTKIALIGCIISVVWLHHAMGQQRQAQQRQAQQRLVTPVATSCISSPFGQRVLRKKQEFHGGIDLPAPEGAPVLATAAGKVMRIQSKGIGGLEMLVQHNKFVGIYSHLGAIEPDLAEGSVVKSGEKLGTVGLTGRTYGMHLYFAMLQDGKPVDPAAYFRMPLCPGVHQPDEKPDAKVLSNKRYYVLRADGSVLRAYLPLNMELKN